MDRFAASTCGRCWRARRRPRPSVSSRRWPARCARRCGEETAGSVALETRRRTARRSRPSGPSCSARAVRPASSRRSPAAARPSACWSSRCRSSRRRHVSRTSSSPPTSSRTWSSPTGATRISSSGGSARPAVARRGDPAPAAARRLHLRGRPVHPRRLARAGRRGRRRHVRLLARPRHAARVDHRRDGPLRRVRAAGHARRRRAAERSHGAASASIEQAELARTSALRLRRGDGGFVTGQLVRIDLDARTAATIVNAGHPRAVPAARRAASTESSSPPTRRSARSRTGLDGPGARAEPGDRLLFLTDGMLERNARPRRPGLCPRARTCTRARRSSTSCTPSSARVGGELADDATVAVPRLARRGAGRPGHPRGR